jgi:hypothetical protein
MYIRSILMIGRGSNVGRAGLLVNHACGPLPRSWKWQQIGKKPDFEIHVHVLVVLCMAIVAAS